MNRLFHRYTLLATLLATFSAVGFAQALEIKGLRLGMSQFDVQDLHGQLPLRDFTIAGVRSKNSISPDFLNGRMERFTFYFDSAEFDTVRPVVAERYPKMHCDNSVVSNSMGAKLRQTECFLKGSDGVLLLSRFVSDSTTSSLTMIANAVLERQKKKDSERHKDF